MEIVNSREFRSNQTAILTKALSGEPMALRTSVGLFRLLPIKEKRKEDLTTRICEGLKEVKFMQDGKLPKRNARDFLNEL